MSVVRNSVGSQELEGCGTGTLGGMAGGGPHHSLDFIQKVEINLQEMTKDSNASSEGELDDEEMNVGSESSQAGENKAEEEE